MQKIVMKESLIKFSSLLTAKDSTIYLVLALLIYLDLYTAMGRNFTTQNFNRAKLILHSHPEKIRFA